MKIKVTIKPEERGYGLCWTCGQMIDERQPRVTFFCNGIDCQICGLCLEAGPGGIKKRIRRYCKEYVQTIKNMLRFNRDLLACEWEMPSPQELDQTKEPEKQDQGSWFVN